MTPHEILTLLRIYLPAALTFFVRLSHQKLLALVHRHYAYKPTPNPQNVIVIGGSFTGLQVAQRLTQTLPTGYKVVLVEKNECFNYLFAFPRFSVMPGGWEEMAFWGYEAMFRSAPTGSFERVQGIVDRIGDQVLHLHDDGRTLPFAYAVIATGSAQSVPAKLLAREKMAGCEELRAMQEKVKGAAKIAVVGGGAVGVQIVGDIKGFYPEKEVVLVHSREYLLPSFGPKLQRHAKEALEGMGVCMRLGERPALAESESQEGLLRLRWSDGTEESFDLVIPCTGQRPNSSLISELIPDAISKSSNHILVSDRLQVTTPSGEVPYANIFALGDVAETGGPKMARAGMMQAEVVVQNILNSIEGRPLQAVYKPNWAVEGSIKLTLGIHNLAIYTQTDQGEEILISSKRGAEDLDIKRAWKWLGADMKEFPSRTPGKATSR